MARKKASAPDIFSLRILMTLWLRTRPKLPDKVDDIRGKKTIEIVHDALKDDGIIKESRNLLLKLIGTPAPAQQKEGINPEILDNIVSVVLKKIPVPGLSADTKLLWYSFDKIVREGIDLELPANASYYVQLTPLFKEQVDALVRRKLDTLFSEEELFYFAVHFFNETEQKGHIGRMEINFQHEYAILSLMDDRPDMRTDSSAGYFGKFDSTFYLTLVPSGKEQERYRMSLSLSIVENDLRAVKMIKGTYSYMAFGVMPVAGPLLMVRYPKDKREKYISENIENVQKDAITFDLLTHRRILLPVKNIKDTNDLSTARTFQLITNYAGVYLFGYLARPNVGQRVDKVILGKCILRNTGLYDMKIYNEPAVRGYVKHQQIFFENMLRLSNSFDNVDPFRYDFVVQCKKDSNGKKVLEGVYSGLRDGKIQAGEVMFIHLSPEEISSDEALDNRISKMLSANIEAADVQTLPKDLAEYKIVDYLTHTKPDQNLLFITGDKKTADL